MDRNGHGRRAGLWASASLSARRAWIEMPRFRQLRAMALKSLSARRAWIEMGWRQGSGGRGSVALRKESVDRNIVIRQPHVFVGQSLSARRAWIEIPCTRAGAWCSAVALRKESVDRNHRCCNELCLSPQVALRKESVDRNLRWLTLARPFWGSLSARRAWIEISVWCTCLSAPYGRSPQGERG